MAFFKSSLQQRIWGDTIIKLIPLFTLAVFGAIFCGVNGNIRGGDISDKLFALAGVVLFFVASVGFIQTLTHTLTQLLSAHPARRLNKGRANALRFIMRAFGYIAIIITTMELVSIPVGNLLLGGAAIGIILGVAAQQALANFFASIVLIITHPFAIGDTITFNAGALGGIYEGLVKDIGLSHTRLKLETGELVMLPNATLLSSATITFAGKPK